MKNLSSRLLFLVLSSLISLPSFTNPQFPLKIVENNRYLTDQNNVPFYWLGDTEWDIFRDFTLADAETLLENRAEKGFSVIQTMIFGVSGGTRPNLMGEKPFIKDDPEKPNEAFFKFVDSVVEIANNKGLIVVLGIYHKSDDYGRLITMKNARTWARWIGQRYKNNKNIIWSMFPSANDSYVPIVRELTAGLMEGDGAYWSCLAGGFYSYGHGGNWMRSHEFQIQEGDCGDYWGCAGAIFDIKAKKDQNNSYTYEKNGDLLTFSTTSSIGRHCIKFPDAEKPSGEWNTLDLYCFGRTSVHVVNGVVNMILQNSRQSEGTIHG